MNLPMSRPGSQRSQGSILIEALLILLIIALGAFGYWAYTGRQDYKNNTDQKINAAVASAEKTQAAQLQAQYNQQAKSPYKTFTSSPTYGSISFQYPKSWSAYVDETQQSEPIDAYFFPDEVPGIQSGTAFALRLELVSTSYSDVMQQYSSQIQQGQVTARAFLPAKLKGVANVQAGTLLSGQVNQNDNTQTGTMLVISVRDKTLELYTESNKYLGDFNKPVLSSLIFSP